MQKLRGKVLKAWDTVTLTELAARRGVATERGSHAIVSGLGGALGLVVGLARSLPAMATRSGSLATGGKVALFVIAGVLLAGALDTLDRVYRRVKDEADIPDPESGKSEAPSPPEYKID